MNVAWRAGTATLCRSQLYPPVRDYEFGYCSQIQYMSIEYTLAESPTPPLFPPRIWAHIRGRCQSAKIDYICLWPSG
jgi:hypothetical protein